MKKSREFGEFFPSSISAYGYNESLAGEFFPITKKEAKKQGFSWRDEEERKENYMGPKTKVPEAITEVSSDITEKILLCEATKKPYRITVQELKFYEQLGIPLPRICPQERHMQRMAARRPRQLWERECKNCKKKVQSTYSPDRPEIIYCESCYLRSIY